jgi:hypothetical protein
MGDWFKATVSTLLGAILPLVGNYLVALHDDHVGLLAL